MPYLLAAELTKIVPDYIHEMHRRGREIESICRAGAESPPFSRKAHCFVQHSPMNEVEDLGYMFLYVGQGVSDRESTP